MPAVRMAALGSKGGKIGDSIHETTSA